jgi:hypothetical protein
VQHDQNGKHNQEDDDLLDVDECDGRKNQHLYLDTGAEFVDRRPRVFARITVGLTDAV